MVDTVLCKLELPDFIRTAAVCTCWRAPALDLRRRGVYSFHRTPCLLYIPAAAAANGGSSTRSAELYCLADERPYTVTLPDPPIAERSIVGSSHGWLVTADALSELHLLNPVTREQIELPPIATLEQVRPILEAAGDGGDLRGYEVSFYDGDMREYRAPGIYRPDELRDLLNIKQPSFARVGDDKQWHWITTSSYYRSPYSDIAYRDGAFYAMNLLGGIHRYDIHHSRATRTVVLADTLGYTLHHAYMAWTPSSGDVLQVWRLTHLPEDEEDEELRTVGFHVYKVDFDSQDVVPIDSLGDEALFIGHNGTLCLSTKDYPALLPNHVYFTDDDEY
ncbi:probable F-box protein At1g65740 [Oryza glaberrima]|uniref:probable F-box protein At1g65740 n=1 Tax=Oryza glaberrima TaxID=4538 RepID=UPI00224C3A51|nr:probable F-box protein At1g65740 [Oryza glaberrima]